MPRKHPTMPRDHGQPSILIMVDDAHTACRWNQWLSGVADVQWCGESDDPNDYDPDVIATPAAAARCNAGNSTGGRRPFVGWIVVGPALAAADVSLPDDVTEREFALAARLLLRVVQLSRQNQCLESQRRSLERIARLDPLTHVANRREWDGRLREILRISDSDLCLAIIDLDHFKRVNDVQGHAAGDDLLRRAAARLRESVRQCDLVARLGGDEFGLLLRGIHRHSAANVVERARRSIAHRHRDDDPTLTASAGFTLSPAGSRADARTLYGQASAALQQAKAAGRNRAVGR